jgi:hypothetical protein
MEDLDEVIKKHKQLPAREVELAVPGIIYLQ